MKRWNGWGSDTITYEVPRLARENLGEIPGSLPFHSATILHRLGVGTDDAPFLPVEIGISWMDGIRCSYTALIQMES